MKKIIVFIPILLLFACNSNQVSFDKTTQQIVDSLTNNGCEYIGNAEPAYGFDDSLIWGHTNRKNGVFHNTKFEPKSLTIKGFQFEQKDTEFTVKKTIYKFNFKNPKEQKEFEAFQEFFINYQTHSKAQVDFFLKDSIWYLDYIGMP